MNNSDEPEKTKLKRQSAISPGGQLNQSDVARELSELASTSKSGAGESRRGFLRDSSLWLASTLPTAAAAKTASAANVTQEHSQSDNQRYDLIRIGLIGCGRSGTQLCAAAMSTSRVQLTAMADVTPSRIQQAIRPLKSRSPQAFQVEAANRFVGEKGYLSLLESGVDAVIVAVPYAMRAEVATAACRRGVHVYVEQPFAVLPNQLHSLPEYASQPQAQQIASGFSRIYVGSRFRLANELEAVVARIRDGLIGNVESIHGDYRAGLAWPKSLIRLADNIEQATADPSVQRSVLSGSAHHYWQACKALAGDGTLKYRASFIELCNQILQPMESLSCLKPEACGMGPRSPSRTPGLMKMASVRGESHVEYGCGAVDSRVRFNFVPTVATNEPTDALSEACEIPVTSRVQLTRSRDHALEQIVVRGSLGSCDLLRGQFYDFHGRLLEKVSVGKSGRCDEILEWIEQLERRPGQPTGDQIPVRAVDSLLAAMMAQIACETGEFQTPQSALQSDFAYSENDLRFG